MLSKVPSRIRRIDALSIVRIENDLYTMRIISKRRYYSSDLDKQHPQHNHLVQSTRKWIDLVVIGEKLCPFAPPLINSNTIRIVASSAQCAKDATNDVKVELDLLLRPTKNSNDTTSPNDIVRSSVISNPAMNLKGQDASEPLHETTLIVFDGDFVRDFHEFVRLSWIFQTDAVMAGGYVHDVQQVLFHPNAKHQTYGTDDQDGNASDFTIRSPYPLVHLLREEDVLRAVSGSYPNLADLPSRNKQKMLSQGFSFCKRRLMDCYEGKTH